MAIFIGRILLYKINRGDIAYLLLKYNCVFVMGGSIALFILFKSIDLGVNKKINYISSLTFGVYLIHDNRYIRGILYDNILNTQRWFNSNYLIIDFIISVVAIFIVCCLIEYIRSIIFKILKLDTILIKIVDRINNKLEEKTSTNYLMDRS